MSDHKGPRLYLKPAEIDRRTGKIRKRSTWIIRDGESFRHSTGCAPEQRAEAERALAAYLAEKHAKAPAVELPASEVWITHVLRIYSEDVAPKHKRPKKTAERLLQLAEWWGDKRLSEITGRTVRQYTSWRCAMPWKSTKPEKTGNAPRMVTEAGVRRELEDLRAAVNYHRKEGYCREVVEVPLPDRSQPEERWLTREEVARLLWTAWRHREHQNGLPTAKHPWRHLARFIVAGVYTGTRQATITGAALKVREGAGYIDLARGVFYRRPQGEEETNKRRPPIRLPKRLLAHIKRWAQDRGEDTICKEWLIEWNGQRVGEVNKGFRSLVIAAGLDPDQITPHTLRHTCATWLMQAGADLWDAAGFLGMSVATLERVYGHHHPDHQKSAVDSLSKRNRS
jgi:integrase